MPTIRTKEMTFYYEEAGQGEPLLLLHGLGSSTADWPLQMESFAARYRVIAVDLRGHGRSTKPPGPYSIPMFCTDIIHFLEVMKIASAHILGISLDGMIAFQLAVSSPETVKSLVIVNSVPSMVVKGFGDKWLLWQRSAIVELMGVRRMGEYLAPRLFPKPEQAELRQEIIQRWAQNDKQAYLASMRSFVGWDVSPQLADIHCPTLVISADEDYWPLSDKEAYTARIPQAQLLVIEDSRHATPVDQPEVFNTAVLDFLSSVS
ncbi:MAG: alpha/beta fold hydrolase [Anaerolineales bacterium]|nr:alpha/beta fold hydrolase [Anaerolineales bacterium]